MCSEWHGEWCANFHGNVEKFFLIILRPKTGPRGARIEHSIIVH